MERPVAVAERGGTTLCRGHAKQVAATMSPPSGECQPSPTWIGGQGQTVTCDVVGAPERVTDYLAEQERRRELNRRGK